MPELPDIVVYIERLRARVQGQVLKRARVASPFLVRSVEPGSRAGRAGIRTGDVLVRAGPEPLRSVTALCQAINAARSAGSLTITAVRGVDTEVDAVVDLGPDPAGETPPGRPPPGPGAATHNV